MLSCNFLLQTFRSAPPKNSKNFKLWINIVSHEKHFHSKQKLQIRKIITQLYFLIKLLRKRAADKKKAKIKIWSFFKFEWATSGPSVLSILHPWKQTVHPGLLRFVICQNDKNFCHFTTEGFVTQMSDGYDFWKKLKIFAENKVDIIGTMNIQVLKMTKISRFLSLKLSFITTLVDPHPFPFNGCYRHSIGKIIPITRNFEFPIYCPSF